MKKMSLLFLLLISACGFQEPNQGEATVNVFDDRSEAKIQQVTLGHKDQASDLTIFLWPENMTRKEEVKLKTAIFRNSKEGDELKMRAATIMKDPATPGRLATFGKLQCINFVIAHKKCKPYEEVQNLITQLGCELDPIPSNPTSAKNCPGLLKCKGAWDHVLANRSNTAACLDAAPTALELNSIKESGDEKKTFFVKTILGNGGKIAVTGDSKALLNSKTGLLEMHLPNHLTCSDPRDLSNCTQVKYSAAEGSIFNIDIQEHGSYQHLYFDLQHKTGVIYKFKKLERAQFTKIGKIRYKGKVEIVDPRTGDVVQKGAIQMNFDIDLNN